MGRRFRPGALFLELPNFSDVQHWWPEPALSLSGSLFN